MWYSIWLWFPKFSLKQKNGIFLQLVWFFFLWLCSFISTRLLGGLCLPSQNNIPRFTAWSSGLPMRFAPSPSSGNSISCDYCKLFIGYFCVYCFCEVFWFKDSFVGFSVFFWWLLIVMLSWFVCLLLFRYFLRKLKKVKKSNGQVLAINEVHFLCSCFVVFAVNFDQRISC